MLSTFPRERTPVYYIISIVRIFDRMVSPGAIRKFQYGGNRKKFFLHIFALLEASNVGGLVQVVDIMKVLRLCLPI